MLKLLETFDLVKNKDRNINAFCLEGLYRKCNVKNWRVCVCVFTGVFRGNKAQVKEYQDLLEPIIFQSYEGT